jgi:hypothetical protein
LLLWFAAYLIRTDMGIPRLIIRFRTGTAAKLGVRAALVQGYAVGCRALVHSPVRPSMARDRRHRTITLDGYAASHRAVREMKADGQLRR